MPEATAALLGLLRDVGGELEVPPSGDLASAVRARLRSEPPPPRRFAVSGLRSRAAFRPVVRRSLHAVVAAALAVLLAVAGAVSLWTPARQAVAGWLGLRGVRIRLVPSPPSGRPPATTPPAILGRDLALGGPVSLAGARSLVPYAIRTPTDPALGSPDAIYESPALPDGLVSFVYGARPELPLQPDGVSVLFMQFTARIDGRFLLVKDVGPGTTLRALRIEGKPGFWLTGQQHMLGFIGRGGRPVFDSQRLAGNVLLWQDGDRVFRLEGAFTKAQALRIARSVR